MQYLDFFWNLLHQYTLALKITEASQLTLKLASARDKDNKLRKEIVKPKSSPKSKSQIPVPYPSPKFRSQIQDPNPIP